MVAPTTTLKKISNLSPFGAWNPLLDFHVASGEGFYLQDLDIGSVPAEAEFADEVPDPSVREIQVHRPLVDVRMVLKARANTMAKLISMYQELALHLNEPGIYLHRPDTGQAFKYFDGFSARLPTLYHGNQGIMLNKLVDTGLEIIIPRMPFLYRDKMTATNSSLLPGNGLTNSTLLLDRGGDGRPDLWAWASATNISNESIAWTTYQAYKFDIATTSTRSLQQTLPNDTLVAGQDWTMSFEVLSAGANVRAYAAIQYLTNAGANAGSEFVSAATTPDGTLWQTVYVTATAPATATKAIVSIRFTNTTATAATVYVRRAMFAKSSQLVDFRVGPETIYNDPATTHGKAMMVYVPGNAPTRGIIGITPDAGLVQMMVSKRSYGNLAELRNSLYVCQAEDTGSRSTLGTNASTAADANASPGSGTSKVTVGFGNPDMLKRLTTTFVPTDKTAIEGAFRVYARVRVDAATTKVVLQARWAPSTASPAPFANEEVTLDVPAGVTVQWMNVDLGTIFIERGRAVTYGAKVEIWARRESGSGQLDIDYVMLMPIGPTASASGDQLARLTTRGFLDDFGSNPEKWLGKDLAGGATFHANGGSYSSGTVQGKGYLLDNSGEACGTKPVGGVSYEDGRHYVFALVTVYHDPNGTDENIGKLVVRDISTVSGVEVASKLITIGGKVRHIKKLIRVAFDEPAGTALNYQFQVAQTSGSGTHNKKILVHFIRHIFTRTTTQVQYAGEYNMGVMGPYAAALGLGVMLEQIRVDGPYVDLRPGLNLLMFDWGDVPNFGYDDVDPRDPLPKSTLSRSATVAVDMYPRYTS